MTAVAYLAVFAWLGVGVALSRRLPPANALAAGFVLGQLFLPELRADLAVEGTPQPVRGFGLIFDKLNVMCLSALIGVLTSDPKALARLRVTAADLPAVGCCVAMSVAALANNLSAADALVELRQRLLAWGVPYFLGRLYLSGPDGLRALGGWVVLGGLLYAPFCLAEVAAGPVLHKLCYGYSQHFTDQAQRFGGYRAVVFMEHGLETALFCVAAALVGGWSWLSGSWPWLGLPEPFRRNGGACVLALAGVAVLSKSLGALALAVAGAIPLVLSRYGMGRFALALLLMVPPAYVAARVSGAWDGRGLTELVGSAVDDERAQSLEFRLDNETQLMEKALRQPLFGWGGWARAHVFDADGKDVSVADGLWVIALGNMGFFGLLSVGGVMLVPPVVFAGRYPQEWWNHPALAPAAALAMVLAIYAVDNLFNAMFNPVYVLAAGALASPPQSRSG